MTPRRPPSPLDVVSANALEVLAYQFFYEGAKPPKSLKLPTHVGGNKSTCGNQGKIPNAQRLSEH